MKAFFNNPQRMRFIIWGLLIGLFFTVTVSFPVDAQIVPAIFFGVICEAIRSWRGGEIQWQNILACAIGGAAVMLLAHIGPIYGA